MLIKNCFTSYNFRNLLLIISELNKVPKFHSTAQAVKFPIRKAMANFLFAPLHTDILLLSDEVSQNLKTNYNMLYPYVKQVKHIVYNKLGVISRKTKLILNLGAQNPNQTFSILKAFIVGLFRT